MMLESVLDRPRRDTCAGYTMMLESVLDRPRRDTLCGGYTMMFEAAAIDPTGSEREERGRQLGVHRHRLAGVGGFQPLRVYDSRRSCPHPQCHKRVERERFSC